MISARGLTRIYPRDTQPVVALRDADFEANAGELVLVTGPSGSGKSTLLSIVGLLEPFDEGTLSFASTDVTKTSENERARLRRGRIGYLFQDAGLIERKPIVDNTALPLMYRGLKPRDRLLRATAALESVGLGDRIHHTPGQLSGGERQRAGLARALIAEPDLLICDEPTAALDADTASDIARRIVAARERGSAIILATHDRDLYALADRIYELKHGRIVDVRGPKK
tara:strand:- start:789 stop:1469 length:681 start_codon:yes stop_codon:yes gene_type:complete